MRRRGVARGDFELTQEISNQPKDQGRFPPHLSTVLPSRNEGDFAARFLTLFYESALMPDIERGGASVGAGVLCNQLHRRPGI